MRTPKNIVILALNDYYKGHSSAQIVDTFTNLFNYKVGANTVRRWVEKFPASISNFVKNMPLITGELYSADELYILVKGILKYMFALNDTRTRFCLSHEMAECKDGHNAAELLMEAAKEGRQDSCRVCHRYAAIIRSGAQRCLRCQ